MKLFVRGLTASAAILAVTLLGACSAERALDNTVDASLFVGKTAVKGTVGAAKLAGKGVGSVYRKATED